MTSLPILRTPERIQDFLDALPYNFEENGETCSSPLSTLARGSAHCLEGALVGALALMKIGEKPYLMNLKTAPGDQDHAVTLFKRNGLWGALSKTNHAVLRYRDPVYRTPRELALSYFHEYYLQDSGRKTLKAYSKPFSLSPFGTKWMTEACEVWDIAYALADAPHLPVIPQGTKMRPATPFERRATATEEWKRP